MTISLDKNARVVSYFPTRSNKRTCRLAVLWGGKQSERMGKQEKETALVIIDMPKDFVLPGAPSSIAGAHETIPRVREVLDWFREKKWPVFYAVREHRQDGSDVEITRLEGFLKGTPYVIPGTKGCDIVNELTPLPHEYRVVKRSYSAFMNTEFDFMLQRLGIKNICICGTQYPVCIRTSVFDGVAYGYNVTVLTDATSAQTLGIARANIRDIKDIGVACLAVKQFKKLHT